MIRTLACQAIYSLTFNLQRIEVMSFVVVDAGRVDRIFNLGPNRSTRPSLYSKLHGGQKENYCLLGSCYLAKTKVVCTTAPSNPRFILKGIG